MHPGALGTLEHGQRAGGSAVMRSLGGLDVALKNYYVALIIAPGLERCVLLSYDR